MKEEKGEGERILFRGSSEKLLTGSKTRFVDISLETLDFLILTKIEEKERKERKKKKRKKKTYYMEHYINGNLRVFFFIIFDSSKSKNLDFEQSFPRNLKRSCGLIKYSTIPFLTKKYIVEPRNSLNASTYPLFFLSPLLLS